MLSPSTIPKHGYTIALDGEDVSWIYEVERSRVDREVCLFRECSVFVCREKSVCLPFEFLSKGAEESEVKSRYVVENVLMDVDEPSWE
uniref:Uncharacterized protein n=1 Tax=Tanacetum cinerariifolium TaxID=118510 RepID=A0A6L2KS66_TANCI|nr:hypothetical protein [Tanacetum cinerariifolium]